MDDVATAPTTVRAGLPWQAALVPGASWVLSSSEGTSVSVSVESVDNVDGVTTYHLAWSEEGFRPSELHVRPDGTVTVDEVALGDMQPLEPIGGEYCYAEDLASVGEDCSDVCDASFCLTAAGIAEVGMLYAPDLDFYKVRK